MTNISLLHAPTLACQQCPVRQSGFCSWFDPARAARLAAHARQSKFVPDRTILRQGERVERVGTLRSGLVKMVVSGETGEEHVIQLLHAGALIGGPLMAEAPVSWVAATASEICWIRPGTLAAAMEDQPAAWRGHSDATTRLVTEQRFAQIALRGRNALQRVAHWLFLQVPGVRTNEGLRLRILLSRRDLASLLEMQVETLCRTLHQLVRLGAIRLAAPDLAELCDLQRLGELARVQGPRDPADLPPAGWEWGARPIGTLDRVPAIEALSAVNSLAGARA